MYRGFKESEADIKKQIEAISTSLGGNNVSTKEEVYKALKSLG